MALKLEMCENEIKDAIVAWVQEQYPFACEVTVQLYDIPSSDCRGEPIGHSFKAVVQFEPKK